MNAHNEDRDIERLLRYLGNPWFSSESRRRLKSFSGALPLYGAFMDIREEWSGSPGIWTDAEPDATGMLADITLLLRDTFTESGRKLQDCYPTRIAFVSPQKARITFAYMYVEKGKVDLHESVCIRNEKSDLFKMARMDGQSKKQQVYESGKEELVRLTDNGRAWKSREEVCVPLAKLAPGIFFNTYHEWSVSFRIGDTPSVRIPVLPRTALELFVDREKSQGKLRRDALLHWVKAHLRRKPQNDDLVEVRKHIRGKEKFFWRGFECIISPDMDYLRTLRK